MLNLNCMISFWQIIKKRIKCFFPHNKIAIFGNPKNGRISLLRKVTTNLELLYINNCLIFKKKHLFIFPPSFNLVSVFNSDETESIICQ
jgi:hypothetical protein